MEIEELSENSTHRKIRVVDAKRLQYKLGTVKEDEFAKTKEALIALLK